MNIDADYVLRGLMGIGTLGIGWAGWALNKRGAQETAQQQAAVSQLQTRVNTVDELESVIEHLKEERDYIAREKERLASQHTAEADRQAARCQVQLDRLIDNVATLQSIVTDEIARSSALDTVRDAQNHEASEHGRIWSDGDTRY